MITANRAPDNATIARFRVRHEVALIALDGTKISANPSRDANRTYEYIARGILEQAAAADAADDQRLGDRRGDELPERLADRSSRKARLHAAKERLEAEASAAQAAHSAHLQTRAALESERGRKLRGRKPLRPAASVSASARANTTDPDSRLSAGRCATNASTASTRTRNG